jgi:hypothetical protein
MLEGRHEGLRAVSGCRPPRWSGLQSPQRRLGILVGEQIIPVTKLLIGGSSLSEAFHLSSCDSHIFGMLPGRRTVGPIDGLKNSEKQA